MIHRLRKEGNLGSMRKLRKEKGVPRKQKKAVCERVIMSTVMYML